jgi:hypothetical protein
VAAAAALPGGVMPVHGMAIGPSEQMADGAIPHLADLARQRCERLPTRASRKSRKLEATVPVGRTRVPRRRLSQ